jgi:hypothetical protein
MKCIILSIFLLTASSGFTQTFPVQSLNLMFANVENPQWHLTDEGSTVKFTQDNIAYHIFYNKRGKWKATIRNLAPEMLPRWVTGRVKSEFRHFSIFFAQHVKTPAGNAYLVKIENGNDWKNISITTQNTEVLGEYVRN